MKWQVRLDSAVAGEASVSMRYGEDDWKPVAMQLNQVVDLPIPGGRRQVDTIHERLASLQSQIDKLDDATSSSDETYREEVGDMANRLLLIEETLNLR